MTKKELLAGMQLEDWRLQKNAFTGSFTAWTGRFSLAVSARTALSAIDKGEVVEVAPDKHGNRIFTLPARA